MAKAKVSITQKALIARINRRLKDDDQILRASRSERSRQDLGWYYVVDFRRNLLVHRGVNLEPFGRELGVLKGWERLED